MFRSLFVGFIILSTCNCLIAQEWYEKPLAMSNCSADTVTSTKEIDHLLVFYNRLIETNTNLWIAHYYIAYLEFKKSFSFKDKNEQILLLKNARASAQKSMVLSKSNSECITLAGIIDQRVNELLEKNKSNSTVFFFNKISLFDPNPRTEYYKTKTLILGIENKENIAKADSVINQALVKFVEEKTSDCPDSPSWGIAELKQLKNEIEKKSKD